MSSQAQNRVGANAASPGLDSCYGRGLSWFRGQLRLKHAPPRLLLSLINARPPCQSMIRRTIDNPNPCPPYARVRLSSRRGCGC